MENITKLQRINSISISGTVGAEDSIYHNEKGNMVSFSIAQYVGKNNEGEKITVWHKVRAFASDRNPLNLSLVRKGTKLVIRGHFEGRSYVNKNGEQKIETYIVAEAMEENVPVEYVPASDYADTAA